MSDETKLIEALIKKLDGAEMKLAEKLAKQVLDEIIVMVGLICRYAAWSRVYREVLVAALRSKHGDFGTIPGFAKQTADFASQKYDEFDKQLEAKRKQLGDMN
jgi:hypothetical protein